MQINPRREKISRQITEIRSLLLLLCLTLAFNANAQILDKPISIHIKNKPLPDAIKAISVEGNINFSYNPQSIPADKTVSINCSKKPLKEVLDAILKPAGITFFELEDQVVLKAPAAGLIPPQEEHAKTLRHITISGYIREKSSGEVLIGANVYASGTAYGTNTNSYGFYSLTLPEGSYVLDYSFLGFREIKEELDLKSDQRISKEMEEARLDIKEVEVKPKETASDIRRSQLSDFNFSNKTLASLPGFAGAPDILKALQAVPGIRSYGDGSSFFYVRGGNSDQNLLLIDEVHTPDSSRFWKADTYESGSPPGRSRRILTRSLCGSRMPGRVIAAMAKFHGCQIRSGLRHPNAISPSMRC